MITEITSQSPMEAFLINVLGRAPRESWSFDESAPHPNDLNLSTKLGVRMTFGVAEPPPERQQVVTQLFSQFTSLALAGKFGDASGLLTAPSAKRLTGWAATVAEKDRGSFQAFLGERRRILRIAAMGQVDIAFWINARISQPKPEDLQYSYVLWDSQSRPLLANLLFQGILDDVLRRNPEVSRWSGIPEPPPEPPPAPAGAKPPAAGLPARSGSGSGRN
jgi:hypothetical protein